MRGEKIKVEVEVEKYEVAFALTFTSAFPYFVNKISENGKFFCHNSVDDLQINFIASICSQMSIIASIATCKARSVALRNMELICN